jgi:hypothetical protein
MAFRYSDKVFFDGPALTNSQQGSILAVMDRAYYGSSYESSVN